MQVRIRLLFISLLALGRLSCSDIYSLPSQEKAEERECKREILRNGFLVSALVCSNRADPAPCIVQNMGFFGIDTSICAD